MNEDTKQGKIPLKGKTAGKGGLSKKERRAVRIAQKAETSNGVPKQKEVNTGADVQKIKAVHNSVHNVEDTKNKLIINKTAERPIVLDTKNKADFRTEKHALPEKQPKAAKGEKPVKTETVTHKAEISKSKENGEIPSKAQLKAERRALQEKQRLAKSDQENKKEFQTLPTKIIIKKTGALKSEHLSEHQVNLFNHLYFSTFINESKKIVTGVHSTFIQLGVQYSSKAILGSNARCLALLSALKDLVNDFVTPTKQEFCRSLEAALQKSVSHLQKCRPFAVSMTNALRHFKLALTQINANLSDSDKKAELLQSIEIYIQDEIAKAGEAISMKVTEKITNDDIIVTYGCSSLIRRLLLDAHRNGKKFKVIVVDSRPLLEGREMLRVLTNHGIDCIYILINSVSFIMSKATKVLLGAHALLANGYVMSRTGTAQVALIAQAYSKPVLVCCETYKFCERVQTDCFVYNEIGDPDKLLNIDTLEEESPLMKWRNSKYLTPLNLLYDITPTDLVTAVVTELGFLPCTSVPVILRIKPTE